MGLCPRNTLFPASLVATALVVLAGCNNSKLNTLPATNSEVHYQGGGAPPVDVLFMVDDSGSMSDKQQKLATDFQQFIQYFQDLHLDFHLGITTSDTLEVAMEGSNPGEQGKLVGVPKILTNDTQSLTTIFTTNALVGSGGWRVERGLEATRLALSEPNLSGANAGFFRPNAILAVILLSDENDQSMSNNSIQPPKGTDPGDADNVAWRNANLEDVNDFINFFLSLKNGNSAMVNVSAITGVDQTTLQALDPANDKGCNTTPGATDSYAAADGTRYAMVARALHGVVGSICADGFGPVLNQIGATVSGVATAFPLQFSPDPASITVTVDGTVIPQGPNGWTYNATTNTIEFASGATPPQCAVIQIDYGVADYGNGITTGNNEVPPAQCGLDGPPPGGGNSLEGGAFSCSIMSLGGASSAFGTLLGLCGIALAIVVRRRAA